MRMSAARLLSYGNEIELGHSSDSDRQCEHEHHRYGKHGDAEHGYDASFECLIYDV